MKSTITKEAIKNAIETLEQQGIYPSIEKIRQITGGSSSRISKLRKELAGENQNSSNSKNSFANSKTIGQEIVAQIESRMMHMELLFTQRFADIDARFAAKDRDNKDTIIKGLQSKNQSLESKNVLLVKQLHQKLARVKELGQKLKQANDKIAELEANPVKKSKQLKPTVKLPVQMPLTNNTENNESKQAVIQSFNTLVNAQWDEEQNAEISLQKAVRQWLIEKWPTDSHLLVNAVIDSNINDKRYIAVSVSEDTTSTSKPYIVHCLILVRDTERFTWQRKDYTKVEAAHNKARQWLNI